jgi:hypothetical protein
MHMTSPQLPQHPIVHARHALAHALVLLLLPLVLILLCASPVNT